MCIDHRLETRDKTNEAKQVVIAALTHTLLVAGPSRSYRDSAETQLSRFRKLRRPARSTSQQYSVPRSPRLITR